MRCRSERPAPLEALRVIVEQSGTPIRSGAGRVLRNSSYLFPIQFSSPKKRASICAKDSAPAALNPNTYKGTSGQESDRKPRPSLQQRLVKTDGRLLKHARYYWLLRADSHLTRRGFRSMLRSIATLQLPMG